MINANDIVKMKVKVSGKPLIWSTPHYYLCWDNRSSKNSFFIFTSNFLSLFANNTCDTNDVVIVETDNVLPFTKRTYLVHNESFNIKNIIEPASFYKKEKAFEGKKFLEYERHGDFAKQYNVQHYVLK